MQIWQKGQISKKCWRLGVQNPTSMSQSLISRFGRHFAAFKAQKTNFPKKKKIFGQNTKNVREIVRLLSLIGA